MTFKFKCGKKFYVGHCLDPDSLEPMPFHYLLYVPALKARPFDIRRFDTPETSTPIIVQYKDVEQVAGRNRMNVFRRLEKMRYKQFCYEYPELELDRVPHTIDPELFNTDKNTPAVNQFVERILWQLMPPAGWRTGNKFYLELIRNRERDPEKEQRNYWFLVTEMNAETINRDRDLLEQIEVTVKRLK